jgi:hypothetical protein
MLSLLLTSCSAPKKHVETTPSDLPRPTETSIETEPTAPEETLPPYHCINPKFEKLSEEEI